MPTHGSISSCRKTEHWVSGMHVANLSYSLLSARVPGSEGPCLQVPACSYPVSIHGVRSLAVPCNRSRMTHVSLLVLACSCAMPLFAAAHAAGAYISRTQATDRHVLACCNPIRSNLACCYVRTALRLMVVRDAYCKEDFEWDQLQHLSHNAIKDSNIQLMRQAATASLIATENCIETQHAAGHGSHIAVTALEQQDQRSDTPDSRSSTGHADSSTSSNHSSSSDSSTEATSSGEQQQSSASEQQEEQS
eukprot:GHRR01023274.1.p1 GENE.GHRR01023274.1~~GHRR01023274.1.p1  ORF type:complete len:249 (+),score=71.58 GHRR01023274.1:781-1527(+)